MQVINCLNQYMNVKYMIEILKKSTSQVFHYYHNLLGAQDCKIC